LVSVPVPDAIKSPKPSDNATATLFKKLASLETLPAELVERISEFIPVQAVFALRLPSRTLGHRLALDQRFCYKCLISGDSIPHSWVVEPGTGKQIKECLPNHIAHRSQRDCKYLTRSLSDAGDIVGKGNEKRGVPLGL
jgi:hypothetical protein